MVADKRGGSPDRNVNSILFTDEDLPEGYHFSYRKRHERVKIRSIIQLLMSALKANRTLVDKIVVSVYIVQ